MRAYPSHRHRSPTPNADKYGGSPTTSPNSAYGTDLCSDGNKAECDRLCVLNVNVDTMHMAG